MESYDESVEEYGVYAFKGYILCVPHKREGLSLCFLSPLLEHKRFHFLFPPYLFNLFCYAKDVTDLQGCNPYHLYVPHVRTNYGELSIIVNVLTMIEVYYR